MKAHDVASHDGACGLQVKGGGGEGGFKDKNNLILLGADGHHRPSTENYPDLPAARGLTQTVLPSSAG